MANIVQLNCCGIKELANISHSNLPEDMIWTALINEHERFYAEHPVPPDLVTPALPACRFMIFSQANYFREGTMVEGVPANRQFYGDRLATYIREQGLGEVVEIPEAQNPNSSRWVKPFIWTINREALGEWIVKETARRKWQPNRVERPAPPTLAEALPNQGAPAVYGVGEAPPANAVIGGGAVLYRAQARLAQMLNEEGAFPRMEYVDDPR